jgi:hypothetical protein
MSKLNLGQFVLVCTLVICSLAGARSKNSYQVQSEDFYIKIVDKNTYQKSFKSLAKEEKPTNCRDHIRKILCLKSADTDNQNKGSVCVEEGLNYAHFFEELYDVYPLALQKMFCSLTVINIERSFGGTAYAGIVKDVLGNIQGVEMGIRKSVLDENLNLQTWATWKEQLSFGGIADSYTLTKGLPQISTHTNNKVNDFLYFVVAHEFGHIFDFANELNKTKDVCADKEIDGKITECEMAEQSWGAISWITRNRPRLENDFINRSSLCFYSCNQKFIATSNINNLYSDLYNTNFISTYSSIQPWDDFADSLAYYLVRQNLDTKYIVNTAQGVTFDMIMKVNSPVWSDKYNYIKNFLERTDIIYP